MSKQPECDVVNTHHYFQYQFQNQRSSSVQKWHDNQPFPTCIFWVEHHKCSNTVDWPGNVLYCIVQPVLHIVAVWLTNVQHVNVFKPFDEVDWSNVDSRDEVDGYVEGFLSVCLFYLVLKLLQNHLHYLQVIPNYFGLTLSGTQICLGCDLKHVVYIKER